MKKWFSKHKNNFVFGLIGLCFIGAVVLGIILAKEPDKENKITDNKYHFSTEVVERTDTKEYSNDVLQSKHCLDDICISEAKFYYLENEGRVDYTIENIGNKVQSGFLKMIFGGDSLVVAFSDLEPGKVVHTTSQYGGQTIKDMSDYTLDYLTEEEKNSIIVSN